SRRVGAGARPERAAPLRLERRGDAGLRDRTRLQRAARRERQVGVPRRPGRYGPRLMAVRDERAARLRRLGRSRAGFVPLAAALGTVLAWNAFTLLCIAAAGGLACWWLRELGLPRGAALAGGLAFALAPYRVEQSVGHLLGPISILLPLALLGIEKGTRRWA